MFMIEIYIKNDIRQEVENEHGGDKEQILSSSMGSYEKKLCNTDAPMKNGKCAPSNQVSSSKTGKP